MPIISPKEAAEHLGVSVATLRNWTNSGQLQCSKTAGGRRRYTTEGLAKFQAQLPDRLPAIPQSEVLKLNQSVSVLPPGGGGWVVPSVQQYVGIYQAFNRFYYAADQALRDNVTNARTMLNNLVIREPLQARMLASAELPWHIEPEDKKDPEQLKVSQALQQIIEEIPDFLKFKFNLLYAIWYGRMANQIKYIWDYTSGQKRLIVKSWEPVNGDSLIFKWDSEDVGVYVGFYNGGFSGTKELDTQAGQISRAHVLNSQDETYFDDKGYPYRKLGFNERDAFVIHSHEHFASDFLDPLGAGGVRGLGVRSVVYWTWYTSQSITSWMVEFMERVGTGITLYKFLRGNAESYNAAKELAESQSNQAAVMVPVDPEMNGGKPMEGIERIEPSGTGLDNLLKVLDDYFGGQIRRYIVGQDATSRPVPSGMNSGVAQAHEATFDRLMKFDAQNLQDTLTTQLVRVLQRWNFPETTFKCKFVLELEKPDQRQYMDGVKTFVDLGGEVDEDEVRSVLGLSKPDAGAKVLKARQPVPGGGDGSSPGGGDGSPVQPGANRPGSKGRGQWKHVIGRRGGDVLVNTSTGQRRYPGKKRYEANFDEGKHPRADDGKFGSGGSNKADDQPKKNVTAKVDKDLRPEAKEALHSLLPGLRDNKTLTPEQRTSYFNAAQSTLKAMTPKALSRFKAGLTGGASFYSTNDDLKKGLIDKASSNAVKDKLQSAGEIGGCYFIQGDQSSLHLDGDPSDEARAGYGKNGSQTTHEIYCHEMSHAIDGPRHELSNSPEWQEAFNSELKSGKLCKYAAANSREGFAEFGRVLLSGRFQSHNIETAFPKCFAFWEKNGLVPDATVKLDADDTVDVKDVFSKFVDLSDGHADVLLPSVNKYEAIFDESKHPRADDGKFGSGGGSSSKAEDKKQDKDKPKEKPEGKSEPKKEAESPEKIEEESNKITPSTRKFLPKTRDALAKVGKMTAQGLGKVFGTIGHVEHVVSHWVSENAAKTVAKLPGWLQPVVRGTWNITKLGGKAAFATYIAGQNLAEEVSKERGATPEQAKMLRGTLSTIDLIAAKVPTVVGLVFPPAFHLEPLAFAPVASLSYLAYSTAVNPLATIRGARNLVGKVGEKLGVKKKKAKMAKASDHKELVNRVADFLTDDDKFALLMASIDYTGDLESALDLAEEAAKEE